MDPITGPKRRSRNGCWTCRKRQVIPSGRAVLVPLLTRLATLRKKKCDATGFPCQTCIRLKLECESVFRLVWEDDARRSGMRRRGPPVAAGRRKDYAESGATNSNAQDDFAAQTTCSSITEPNKLGDDVGEENLSQIGQSSGQNLASISGGRGAGRVLPLSLGSGPLSPTQQLSLQKSLSQFPRPLGPMESIFLEHYILRFSRTYPTCSRPSNPFLSIFLPLAMQNDVVLDSLLALSGATRWNDGQAELEGEALHFRQRALKGCRTLLEDIENGSERGATRASHQGSAHNKAILKATHAAGGVSLLHLLASSVLFLLYEKVSGDTTWLPHITFINELFECYLQPLLSANKSSGDIVETVSFLHQLFLYNDLVRSTSTHTAPLSSFYLSGLAGLPSLKNSVESLSGVNGASRYFFPNLISRIGAGDLTVTDADIAAWNGVMDWLPSFALDPNKSQSPRADSELAIISDLYRMTARIYRLRVLTDRGFSTGLSIDALGDMPQLASWAMSLITLVSEDSMYETTLLWPIGIAAKELVKAQQLDRSNIISRLQSMERRFQMRHFRRAQDYLQSHWHCQDSGAEFDENGNFRLDGAMLLG